MPTILQIDSSPRADSVSSRLAAKLVAGLKEKAATTIYHRNTAREKYPFVDESALSVLYGGAEPTTEEQKKILTLSDKLIEEFLAADTIIVGVPMWNFGIPASLKAWVDLISRPGRTFKYVAGGNVETMVPAGKKVYIVVSHGGAYPENSPYASYNQVDPYLRTIFAFFSVADVTFIHVDNQGRSGDAPALGLAAAEKQIATLLG